jgi:hypothetical protein
VLEDCITEEQRSGMLFLWAKGLNAKDIHKEMFHVYATKCLPRKAVGIWVEKRGKRFIDDEEVEMDARKWLRQQSKDFYTADFGAMVKRWDKCINVDGGYVEKYMFFSRYEYHMFYVLYSFVTYLLSLLRIYLSACFIFRTT